ncbi:oxidoreductase : Nucleoside-diphosphate-sugar epimerase OS=Singulisphaera acidiphila (strain ATCC BAA-1392 / DSM 18658 / VKM B-2454 / MOB10) GN=Sinac_6089 PE=4 SV=1: Epimerase [Gemmataceae bacterium]|nr:oxidoreductase : Nucleoside-diphosphate-sugar epimerase OS=Singulisphaera acidiphila (strain ATCC BAA-1392 / DSM 18658 / VKM B-2454 / MOB10) GN=Sinac_6089 PE=4 SV=1: Epimerase [Gemmataceae bacterium]VTU01610.1 oxidoreductase : Nucleoside-diphosphate-sugar epimerase OS=Singulisphaera acidiphila (strain ATCC BAA-1392 / DSM 18658 / VKM B-2454 / MOB10) GN=Sinac_6089 PE=4 SV=1: Epimerase [Gemmataceae bacterium]
MPHTVLVTGATGFVGSHVAEALVARGDTVRVLARPGADTAALEKLGVTVVRGDLADPASVKPAVEGVDVVVHAAAKVGDWGPLDDYRRVNVEGLRALLDATLGRSLHRFVHVSTLGVYEARHHYQTDESEPLPDKHIDGYTQSKVETERLALQYHRKQQVPVTILRPGFVYGPRDRTLLPRIAKRLAEGSVMYIARGRYAMNTTYVGNLVDAILLAIDSPAAVGEIFNVTDGEHVTKRRFFEALADGLGLKRPKKFPPVPVWLARILANWRESKFRRENRPHPPRITQAQLKFAGLNLDFSIAKARTKLGYSPRVLFDEGMRRAIESYKQSLSGTGVPGA